MSWQRLTQSKYHNSKLTIEGQTFDSRKEYRRYAELRLLLRAGEISCLTRQKKFVLIPTQREPAKLGPKGGRIPGKVIERECSYYADFVYYDKGGHLVVEDVKSPATRTKDYLIKRKLMLWVHNIQISEI